MSIRNRMLLYFSAMTIALIAVAFVFIYLLFADYREEEFHERQKEKVVTTLRFLTNIQQIDDALIDEMDRLTINDLFDEKLLIFNKDRRLIYSSIDNTPIQFSRDILNQLSPRKQFIEKKDGTYDVVGVYLEHAGKTYFGLSKAQDTFGYSKLQYLKNILILTFISISVVIFLLSFYLSQRISKPLVAIAEQLNKFDLNTSFDQIPVDRSQKEIGSLAEQFNKLLLRLNKAFSFQKHAIHHISHELKTPIAVLVSNFERLENESDVSKIKTYLAEQKESTKELSDIINALLQISKAESGNSISLSKIRLDEIIFDILDEIQQIHPDFTFNISYLHIEEEASLLVNANAVLLKSAFRNLMLNCVQYSTQQSAEISIESDKHFVIIRFTNHGPNISEAEQPFLFQHFFRGQNSTRKRGFGLGLVFVRRILELHNTKISYESQNEYQNIFTITFPLS